MCGGLLSNWFRYMTRKLYSFVNGECIAEVPDNIMFQEVLTSGYLYQMLLVVSVVPLYQTLLVLSGSASVPDACC